MGLWSALSELTFIKPVEIVPGKEKVLAHIEHDRRV